MKYLLWRSVWLLAPLALMGCAALPVSPPEVAAAPDSDPSAISLQSPKDERHWKPYVLPGKRATAYRFLEKDGKRVIEAQANASASMLRRVVNLQPEQLGEVSWSWWVDNALADADLADIDRTDAPAQLLFAFDGDKSTLSPRVRMMNDLARALTGEEPPYATLTYAFATHTPVESVLRNPRSERIRKIIVDSGSGHARQWRRHRRNLAEDFHKAFGEAPGRLIGVAVMTDADNTRSKAKAWYGPIRFHTRDDRPD